MVLNASLLMALKNWDVTPTKTHIKPNHAMHSGKKIVALMASDATSHTPFHQAIALSLSKLQSFQVTGK